MNYLFIHVISSNNINYVNSIILLLYFEHISVNSNLYCLYSDCTAHEGCSWCDDKCVENNECGELRGYDDY